jgi:hypothetical protein
VFVLETSVFFDLTRRRVTLNGARNRRGMNDQGANEYFRLTNGRSQ